LPPAFEYLDDDHASAAAGAWRAEVIRFAWCAVVGWCGDVQEFASERDADFSGTAGEQTVMPDAVEAARQDIEQEAADELIQPVRDAACHAYRPAFDDRTAPSRLSDGS